MAYPLHISQSTACRVDYKAALISDHREENTWLYSRQLVPDAVPNAVARPGKLANTAEGRCRKLTDPDPFST